jgi:DNA-binding response OmpR family regulator
MNKELNVLVVEDQPLMREILETNLADFNYRVFGFDSAEALLATESVIDEVQVAIIDISLPGMDGLALSAHLRLLRKDLIIIILTNHDALDIKFKSIEAGANLFLTKPVDPKALTQAISQLNTPPIRLIKADQKQNCVWFSPLKLKLYTDQQVLKISFKEVKILLLLAKSNVPVEHWQLLELLGLPLDEQGKKHLEVTFSRLRHKIKTLFGDPDFDAISSIRGVGYQLSHKIKLVDA